MSQVYVPLLNWRCTKCGTHGQVEAEALADCLTIEIRLLQAHAARNPQCAAEWGKAGIATERVSVVPE